MTLSSPPAQLSALPLQSSLPPASGELWEEEETSAVFELLDAAEAPASGSFQAAALPSDVGELFHNYRGFVANIGRKILGPGHDLDDLIQDVFLATMKDIHKLRDRERLTAWLGTVATRMAKRRRWRNASLPAPSAEDPTELLEQEVLDGPSPESRLDLAGSVQAVLSLPDELRTPWMLKHVEGHTLEDVAQRCDCSLSTAQRRIQTASGRLPRRRR
jgi:RNA polymerase sigma-70 factor (ECF subfamily)